MGAGRRVLSVPAPQLRGLSSRWTRPPAGLAARATAVLRPRLRRAMAAPGARRPLLLLLLAGLAHGASALFEVKNNGTTCIMASFSASFLTTYETANGSQIVNISLPASAEVLKNGSSCGKENVSDPSLTITFGRGYLLTLNFTKNTTRYSVQHMYFTYNLSDTEHFPNAISKEIYTMDSTTDIKADINKAYRCVSDIRVYMKNVTVVLRDATIQAYLSSGNFSKEETHCTQDGPSPTTGPPSPSPPLVPTNPTVSKYNVTGNNGTCLLASMALQLNITYLKKDNKTVTRAFNISPNDTSSGSCGINLVTLKVENKNRALELQFGMNASSSLFFLQGVRLNMTLPDALVPTFSISHTQA